MEMLSGGKPYHLMNIYIFSNTPDSLPLVIAVDTLRGCGHTVHINPPDGDACIEGGWLILNLAKDIQSNIDEVSRLLKDSDLCVKIGYVGKSCPEELKPFIEPEKRNLARFEHFSDWENLIYRHLWTQ